MLVFLLISALVMGIIHVQLFKLATRKMKNAGAFTIISQIISGLIVLLLIPIFSFSIPTQWWFWVLMFTSCILWGLADRIQTTTRSKLDVGTWTILKRTSTVFTVFIGLVFLKEQFFWKNIIGAVIILIAAFIILFNGKKLTFNKYSILQLLATLCGSVAVVLDTQFSEMLNVPLYLSLTLIIPAVLIIFIEKIKWTQIKAEFKANNPIFILFVGITWGGSQIITLLSYIHGGFSFAAPILASSVVLNALFAFMFLGEKKHIFKKVVAGLLVILAVLIMTLTHF